MIHLSVNVNVGMNFDLARVEAPCRVLPIEPGIWDLPTPCHAIRPRHLYLRLVTHPVLQCSLSDPHLGQMSGSSGSGSPRICALSSRTVQPLASACASQWTWSSGSSRATASW